MIGRNCRRETIRTCRDNREISFCFPRSRKFRGKYEIKLKPDATPYSLFPPRHIPLPLRPKVQEELARMESIGVISKVDEPTPWSAGMLVVLKKAGAMQH